VIFLVELLYILVKKPYAGDRKNWRPVANMLITITILLLYFLMNTLSKSAITLYAPLIILLLLLVCFVYSAYALVMDLKEKYTNLCKKEEADNFDVMDETQRMKFL
jgi:amino acid transporter